MNLSAGALPFLFTSCNLFFGFLSIHGAMEGNFEAAAWYIIIAALCDGMDGGIARWTNTESRLGFELDSMADLVSFGLAPAVIACRSGSGETGFFGLVVGFCYVFAGAFRLARFNAARDGDRSSGYVGLPIPVAGLTMASFGLYEFPFGAVHEQAAWPALTVLLAALMVSDIPYDWPDLSFRKDLKRTVISISILGAVALMAILPRWSLFPLFALYVVTGAARWFVCSLRRRSTGAAPSVTTRQK